MQTTLFRVNLRFNVGQHVGSVQSLWPDQLATYLLFVLRIYVHIFPLTIAWPIAKENINQGMLWYIIYNISVRCHNGLPSLLLSSFLFHSFNLLSLVVKSGVILYLRRILVKKHIWYLFVAAFVRKLICISVFLIRCLWCRLLLDCEYTLDFCNCATRVDNSLKNIGMH